MSEPIFSAVSSFDEWNDVTGALPKGNGWYCECLSIMQDADTRIADLEQACRENSRTISTYENGRVVLLAEIKARDDKVAKLEAEVEEWKVDYWKKEAQNTELLQDSLERDVLVDRLAEIEARDKALAYYKNHPGFTEKEIQEILIQEILKLSNPSETPNSSPVSISETPDCPACGYANGFHHAKCSLL